MTTDVLLRTDDSGIATLTLNRPDVLNALSPESFRVLRGHIQDIAARTDEIGCVVIRSFGKSFCAGFDIKALKANNDAEPPSARAEVLVQLTKLPQPVIMAVQGYCFTGGLELALAGDIIIAAERARFRDTHAKIGLMAGWGLPARLSRRIGTGAAKMMMLTAREIDAQEALRLGLVNMVVPDAELHAKADEVARMVTANSWPAVQWDKRMIDAGIEMSLADALKMEREDRPARTDDVKKRLEKQGW